MSSSSPPVHLFSSPSNWTSTSMAAAVVQSAVIDDNLLTELMDMDSLEVAAPPPSGISSPSWYLTVNPQPGVSRSFSSFLEELLNNSTNNNNNNNNNNTSSNSNNNVENDVTSTMNSESANFVVTAGLPPQIQLRNVGEFSERLTRALQLISRFETEALAQVWVPVVRNDKVMLTTQEQPYSVMHNKLDLLRYRSLSTGYIFPSAKDDESGSHCLQLGLPGRVFSTKAPEWIPNVEFYDRKEYLRIQDATYCHVKGLAAVPVIDPSSRSCLAVIELVTNVEKAEFGTDISIICSALQAVNLSGTPEEELPQVPTEGQETVYAEISQLLRAVCELHKLPIAQTWLPCFHSGVKGVEEVLVGESHVMESESVSLFIRDAPYYISDTRYFAFHQACSEHSLKQGQGVAGKSMFSNQPSFIHDVRNYSIEEYPLVHHARYFKLGAAVAVRLRSLLTGSTDYILEFFLPVDMSDVKQQHAVLDSIANAMHRLCGTLRLVSGDGGAGSRSNPVPALESAQAATKKKHSLESRFHKAKKTKQSLLEREETPVNEASCSGQEFGTRKKLERKRSFNEKTIGLEVLQQYFAGSLKDAAKSIGVCPTTLKRICRQYGISRWPSRKINKVSRSLIKLQGVIDSVQGLEGAVKLNALTGELASAAAAAAAITKRKSTSSSSSKNNEQQAPEEATPTIASQEVGVDFNQNETDGVAGGHMKEAGTTSDEDVRASEEGARGWLTQYLETDVNMGESAETSYKPMKPGSRVHGSSAALAALNNESGAGSGAGAGGLCENGNLERPQASPENVSRVEACNTSSGESGSPSSPVGYKLGGLLSSSVEQLPCTVTVKATLGKDTVRFRMAYTGFGYGRLREEIASRFKLEMESFTLKYLDDDSEWVVLDGDADLEECLDVMKALSCQTIKLVVRERASRNGSSHSLSSVKV